jgi:hypothetical protein
LSKKVKTDKKSNLVIGGYAVALHGYPRYTKDLDIWIKRNQENEEKTP